MNRKQHRGMQSEAHAWSECLDINQFRALSNGIGMGTLRTPRQDPSPEVFANSVTVKAVEGVKDKPRHDSMAKNIELNPFAMPDRVDSANSVEHEACFQANMSFEPSTIPVQQAVAYEPAVAAPAPKRKRNADTVWVQILRQSVAHAFDIGFVALSIAAAITSVILVMGAEATQSHFRTMIPFTIDGYLTVALSVTAVYATYVVYWLLFKIVGGNTLGNHFFGYSAKKSLEAEGSSLTQEHQQIEMF